MKRPRGRPFEKGHRKFGGRPKGAKNKVTQADREFALRVVEDPIGRAKLLDLYKSGKMHPSMQIMLWERAYGRVKQQVDVGTAEEQGPLTVVFGGRLRGDDEDG